MSELSGDREADLSNVISSIVRDAHNEAINKCHHIVLGFSPSSESAEDLGRKICDLYKQ